ncbi:MAG: hypothetical protein V1813_03145 [Candidatus Aenigmatarchaeota archaeon]
MAELWQTRNTVEWYLTEADRYEFMGQYENIPASIGMAQETLTSAMNDPEKDPRFDLVYERLQFCIDKKREFYKDKIELAAKGS